MTTPRSLGPVGMWDVRELRGTAAELHALELPEPPTASAWFLEAVAPALVLGSAEPEAHVDRRQLASAGVELVRRRSGGGAVLVLPDACSWLDLVIPAGHDLWDADVGRAMHWVGELWCGALADLGIGAVVHRGPMRRTDWSAHACFAGLGPGEVLDAAGRKLVGISQRRTRGAARFQTVAYHGAGPAEVVDLLAVSEDRRESLRRELERTTAAVAAAPGAVRAALIARLASL